MEAVEATEAGAIMLATMAGAMVVLAGALYAGAFAVGKLTANPHIGKVAYLFYGILLVSVLVLARTLNFSGFWNWVAGVMLFGYFLAPQAIYRLCVSTHADAHDAGDSNHSAESPAARTTD